MSVKPWKTLQEFSPLIASEWHPTKNGTLTPNDVITGTSRKVWWKCKNGHEWLNEVRRRVDGRNCPYCAGKLVTSENCLAAIHPNISSEWHPIKNGTLKPTDVLPSIAKKVWWQCTQGHEYLASINNRSSKGRGCPYCSGRYATSESNLKQIYPKIAKQWHPTKNEDLAPEITTSKSGKRVWWQCKKGHEWQQQVIERVKDKRECPVCNTLAEKDKNIAEQWHPIMNGNLRPTDVMYASDKKVWWICPFGHEWEATVGQRVLSQSGCPHCVIKSSDLEIRIYTEFKMLFESVLWRFKIEKNEVDIYVENIKLAIELDGQYWHKNRLEEDKRKSQLMNKLGVTLIRLREEPLPLLSSHDIHFRNTQTQKSVLNMLLQKIKSIYKDMHFGIIDSYIKNTNFMNDVEFKSISTSLPKPEWGSSLEMVFPILKNHWNYEKNFPLLPSMFSPQSNKKVWWKCERGHEWQTAINHRSAKSIGCPYCSGRYATSESNLQTDYPEIAKEWHPTKNGELTPTAVRPKSNKKVWWVCVHGHEWQAQVATRHNNGCPYCAGRMRRDYMDVLAEKNEGKCLSKDYLSAKSKLIWVCKKGHEWKATPESIKKGSWCPACKKLHK